MLPAFLIMLREGLEAALIVGIITTYLVRTGRSGWLPMVWVGVFLAIAAALFVGAGLQLLRASFPQRTQEAFEAGVATIATVFMLSMLVWMRRMSRSIAGDLHHQMDDALSSGGAAWGLIAMTFLAVAREGLESVFFLLALFQQSRDLSAPLGALAGIAVAAVLGVAIHRGAVRLNLKRFFFWTGLVLVLVAAGLMASVPRALHEAGLLNVGQTVIVDLAHVLPSDSVVGALLGGLFGYHDAPTVADLAAWAVTLVIGLWLWIGPMRAVWTPNSRRQHG